MGVRPNNPAKSLESFVNEGSSFTLATSSLWPVVLVLVLGAIPPSLRAAEDPLPSWNEGAAKQAILEFVKATTDAASPVFVPPEARIATFLD